MSMNKTHSFISTKAVIWAKEGAFWAQKCTKSSSYWIKPLEIPRTVIKYV